MSHVFHRHVRTDPPIAVAGDGPYIVDAEGKRYLDASGGAAVSSLGHSDAEVVQAIKEQVDRIAYVHTAFFSNRPMEALAEALIAKAPGDLSRVFFVSGGSEAVEAALKLARQYFVEVDQPDRRHFIARRQSYHGSTLGALAVGGNRARRQPFTPVLLETHYVSPCYAYRYKRDDESDEEYAARLGDELEAAILELGPESVLAFVAETVVGASAGAVPPVPGYFARVREICDRFGVLMILDEVMCGMGRTGSLYACEQEGVAPDLLVVAKGVGAGYQPIGAVLVSERIYQAFRDGSGSFLHGHTYMGHATACAAGLAVQRKLQAPGMMERINSLGDGLHGRLEARFGNHHHVGDIRGRGLFRAIELVQDRGSKAPFAPELGLDVRIKAEAMARGLICYPGAGTADGERGNHVLVAPPFIVGAEELDRIVELLGDAVDAAVAAVQ